MNSKEPEIHINTAGPANKKSKFDPSMHPGVLGKFFGAIENATTSISGLVVILLIVIATLITFVETKVDATDYWKSIVLPTVTALFGYLFGKRPK